MSMTELLQEMNARLNGPCGDDTTAPLLRKDEAWKLKALVSEVQRLREQRAMPPGTRVRLRGGGYSVRATITPGAIGTVVEFDRAGNAFVGFDGGADPACMAWVPIGLLDREGGA